MRKSPSADGSTRAVPGALQSVLYQFLQHLKNLGVSPTFFGTDKDRVEIAAVRQTWPNITHQLCFWHVKRAIRMKLKYSTRTNNLAQYDPVEAQGVVPSLEICWGSSPDQRPAGDRCEVRCSCPSSNVLIEGAGRVETSSVEERETVLQTISRHFNAHSLIPDQNGTLRSPADIHRDCATEMYAWCKSRNYPRLWAYFYINWYCPDQWHLWSRSANAREIPVLKTTMIVESHWRRIKHDFLHRFNRPRVDLVLWVLIKKVVPLSLVRMKAILSGNLREADISWRKDFRKQWKDLEKKAVACQSIDRYHTNPAAWTCACESFLTSRFLICKHIVHCFEPVPSRHDFFRRVKRNRTTPFWTDERLVVKAEYRREALLESLVPDDSASDTSESESDLRSAEVSDDESTPGEESSESREPATDYLNFRARMLNMLEICDGQHAKGNNAAVDRMIALNAMNMTFVEEAHKKKNMHTMPHMWGRRWKHPAVMYLT